MGMGIEPYVELGLTQEEGYGIFLVVQWLRLQAPNVGGPGLIPGQGTRSHTLQLKILHAVTKIQHSQTNKYFLKRAAHHRQGKKH